MTEITSLQSNNCELFIDSYLKKISQRFTVGTDTAFEIFSIAAILDRPFDEVHSHILIKGSDGGIDGIFFEGDNGDYTIHVFQCKNYKSLKQNDIEKFRNDFKEVFIYGNKHKPNTEGNARKYISITKASKATATRDLQHLLELGALSQEGGGRSTRYVLNI